MKLKGDEKMKVIKVIAFGYVYLLGLFITLMAFDCFNGEDPFLYQLGGFLISISPAVLLVLLNYFLRTKRKILAISILAYNIFFTIFFGFLENIVENWPMLLVLSVPLLAISIYHYFYKE